jgi:pimeloyl-ACP methyl ester carboxylesterase
MGDIATHLFLPGFAARSRLYMAGLPAGWEAVQPPSPRSSGGRLRVLHDWAAAEVVGRPGPALLAGHSMGAALALAAALRAPEHVAGIVLIAPAVLPLRKPVRKSLLELGRQLRRGTYAGTDVLASARELSAAPLAALRLVRALRRLDLSDQMARFRTLGVPALVVGCTTDTLVTPSHCRRAAGLLGAEYHELELPGGHVWMLDRPAALAALLSARESFSRPARDGSGLRPPERRSPRGEAPSATPPDRR